MRIYTVRQIGEAKLLIKYMSYPLIIRASYALGGAHHRQVNEESEFLEEVKNALDQSMVNEIEISPLPPPPQKIDSSILQNVMKNEMIEAPKPTVVDFPTEISRLTAEVKHEKRLRELLESELQEVDNELVGTKDAFVLMDKMRIDKINELKESEEARNQLVKEAHHWKDLWEKASTEREDFYKELVEFRAEILCLKDRIANDKS